MRHISLFSQTGSEIANLIKAGINFDQIFFDEKSKYTINSFINADAVYNIPKNKVKDVSFLRDCFGDPSTCFITLHGWLNIIPAEICNEYNIFNGHPGLINVYPVLKGKDPQIKAFNSNFPTIGCVIHKVTPGVDDGEIYMHRSIANNCITQDDMFKTLKNISLNLWIDFFKERVYNKKNG